MIAGYVLIVSMLVLGCAIATVGDRIGTKVGKARLSLFNLRPRKTATLVTIVTGGLISASTLGILLAVDKQLRTGLFELEEIQQDLYSARRDFQQTQQQKEKVEEDLVEARRRQQQVQQQLRSLDRALETVSQELSEVLEQQVLTEEQLARTEARLQEAEVLRREAEVEIARIEEQLSQTLSQKATLEGEIAQLQTERQELIARTERVRAQLALRDREIQRNQALLARQERELSQQERLLAQREGLLAELELQQQLLERQVRSLEQNFQLLRERRVAIGRGQVLASATVRVTDPDKADRAVLALLQEANRVAVQLTRPGVDEPEEPTVQIARSELEQLVDRLSDAREYVVRVLSAGNYILGEENVQVFFEAMRNEIVFEEGEVIVATTIDLDETTPEGAIEKIYWLVEAARFQAQRQGILAERIEIGDGRPETVTAFLDAASELEGNIEVRAIARNLTYTSSLLRLDLVVVRNGEALLETTESERESQ
ncbi:Myosin heavy chain [Geitlerinema sp. FC II]|nr:DUF3084 domain-containing protein [Geitlerinema sp. CS-897]PPT10079.1 Myosin heavy chain [Geitlerinema sp. FC II]